jgi:hypothetical protein
MGLPAPWASATAAHSAGPCQQLQHSSCSTPRRGAVVRDWHSAPIRPARSRAGGDPPRIAAPRAPFLLLHTAFHSVNSNGAALDRYFFEQRRRRRLPVWRRTLGMGGGGFGPPAASLAGCLAGSGGGGRPLPPLPGPLALSSRLAAWLAAVAAAGHCPLSRARSHSQYILASRPMAEPWAPARAHTHLILLTGPRHCAVCPPCPLERAGAAAVDSHT